MVQAQPTTSSKMRNVEREPFLFQWLRLKPMSTSFIPASRHTARPIHIAKKIMINAPAESIFRLSGVQREGKQSTDRLWSGRRISLISNPLV